MLPSICLVPRAMSLEPLLQSLKQGKPQSGEVQSKTLLLLLFVIWYKMAAQPSLALREVRGLMPLLAMGGFVCRKRTP